MKIQDIFEKERVRRGLKKAAMARLMGISRTTYWRWQNGGRVWFEDGVKALRGLDSAIIGNHVVVGLGKDSEIRYKLTI